MPKFYKITHLEFNRRDPNKRKRRNVSRRTRVRIGGRLVKPGTYFHINARFFEAHKAEIEAYVKAGRIKVTGGGPGVPAEATQEQDTPVSQDNTQPSVKEVAPVAEPEPVVEKPVEATKEAPKEKPVPKTKPRSAKVKASTDKAADDKKLPRASSRASRRRKTSGDE